MTREMGSLGKDVAAAVADRLDKQVVHHEIIDNLASKMRLRKSHVIRFLEGRSGILERLTTDKTSLSIYTADETFALAAHIRSALRQDPRTAKMMISITCDDGVATLAGLVDPGQEGKDAADVAARVPGVKEVKNLLRTVTGGARHHVEG